MRKPILYTRHSKEDIEVVDLLRKEGVPFEDSGPIEGIHTPALMYNAGRILGRRK